MVWYHSSEASFMSPRIPAYHTNVRNRWQSLPFEERMRSEGFTFSGKTFDTRIRDESCRPWNDAPYWLRLTSFDVHSTTRFVPLLVKTCFCFKKASIIKTHAHTLDCITLNSLLPTTTHPSSCYLVFVYDPTPERLRPLVWWLCLRFSRTNPPNESSSWEL